MTPKTFCQLYIHLVFAVKNRDAMLNKKIRPVIFKYMSGIVMNLGHKSIIIDGAEDHVHMLVGLDPSKSISELVQTVKRCSTLYINKQKLCFGKFYWQEGYGAFSCSHSNIDSVYNYIQNQETHHSKKSFRKEYMQFLNKMGIEFDDKYLFKFLDPV